MKPAKRKAAVIATGHEPAFREIIGLSQHGRSALLMNGIPNVINHLSLQW